MCEKGFKHFSVHFQASNRQACNPLITPWKQSHSVLSAARVIVGFSAELAEQIPNVSHTPGTYQ